jgi:hypothetical protein
MLEKVKTINLRILRILSSKQYGYTPLEIEEARHIIYTLRSSLAKEGEQLPLWETIELNFADRAIDAGFFKLAMIAAIKTLSIHQLSEAEYLFGLDPVKKQQAALAQPESLEKKLFLTRQRQQDNLAFSLRQDQHIAAQVRTKAESSAAHILSVQQQQKAAMLLKENEATAVKLVADNAITLEGFYESVLGKEKDLRAVERMLSMMTSGYYTEPRLSDNGSMHIYKTIVTVQEQSAQSLKEAQAQSALSLEMEQTATARDLKNVQIKRAGISKRKAEKSTADFLDRQTIKALCNRSLVS